MHDTYQHHTGAARARPHPPVSDALRYLIGPTASHRTAADVPTAFALGVKDAGWTVVADRPLDTVIGWRAPASCQAVGVVTPGCVLPGDRLSGDILSGSSWSGDQPVGGGVFGDEVSAKVQTGADVEVAVVVDRTGATAARVTVGGRIGGPTPAHGRLLDCLRRTMGLPTPPPPEGTARLLAVLWLAAVVRTTVGAAASPTWRKLLECHPAVRVLLGAEPGLRLDQMQRIVAISPSTWTWDVLREAEASHGTLAPLCPPGAAGWMDDGVYARWVLADLPSLGRLRSRLIGTVPPTVNRRLERTLADSGLRPATPVAAAPC